MSVKNNPALFTPGGVLPRWLQATAERQPVKQLQLPEQTIREELCYVDTVDGISYIRCKETVERFRLCADGQKEMVESTTSTHVRPYAEGSEAMRCSSSSSRYDDVASAALAPAFTATLGQMLDDFFQYATELQQSLEQQDASLEPGFSWRVPGSLAASSSSSSVNRGSSNAGSTGSGTGSSSSSSSSGLFGWWQRKKENSSAASSNNRSQGGQPSLQQLVRESSSAVQEI